MPNYPRLPEPPAPRHDEPRAHYGARLLCWLVDTQCTATVDTDALELAAYCAVEASRASGYATVVYDRLSALRHQIAQAIAARIDAEGAMQTTTAYPSTIARALADDTPNQGPMAPVPSPVTPRPPAPVHIRF